MKIIYIAWKLPTSLIMLETVPIHIMLVIVPIHIMSAIPLQCAKPLAESLKLLVPLLEAVKLSLAMSVSRPRQGL